MPHSHGKKRATRYRFSRPFRGHGNPAPSTTLVTYNRGDIVDIKMNNSEHKGQAHRIYHGKSARVFNVTKSSVGVEVFKKVNHRLMTKRFHVRTEHVRPSRSREDFLNRVKANEVKRKEAKEKGIKITLKRVPKQPNTAFVVNITPDNAPEQIFVKPFEYLL